MKPAKILADYDVTIESGQLADEADGEREAAMPHEKQEASLPAIP